MVVCASIARDVLENFTVLDDALDLGYQRIADTH
jgi:hypothetical protein